MASATSRARHAGTRPGWTCAHSRGRRWRSSRAWPISLFAEVVEIPRTAAELGDAELRHQRAPGAGDGFLVLAPADGERRGGVDRLRWVEVRPPGGEGELSSGSAVLGRRAARIEASRAVGLRSSSTSAPPPVPLPVSRSCVRLYRRGPTVGQRGKHICGGASGGLVTGLRPSSTNGRRRGFVPPRPTGRRDVAAPRPTGGAGVDGRLLTTIERPLTQRSEPSAPIPRAIGAVAAPAPGRAEGSARSREGRGETSR